MTGLSWHKVHFSGGRSVSGLATWGQRQVWRDMSRMPSGSAYNNTHPVLVPEGVTLDDVLDLVAELTARHEALRTLFEDDGTGGPVQRVQAEGEVMAGVWEDPAGSLVDAARELDRQLEETVFDHAAETPFRVAVIAPGGTPRVIMLCVTHLAADLLSTRLVAAELDAMLRARAAGAPPPPPAPASEPVDVAAVERSPRGQRMERSALAYLREQFTAFPAANLGWPAGPPQPERYWRGGLRSAAAASALRTLAARFRVGSSTVALAATAALLGHLAGRRECGFLLIAGNRVSADLRAAVGTLTQDVPALVDVSGPSFSDVVRAAWSSSMRAYRHGRFDPERAWEVIGEVGAARGAEPELRCFFNDMRVAADAPGAPESGDESEFEWESAVSDDDVTFFLEIGDVFGRPGVMRLTLLADTAFLPPPVIEGFLRGLERLLVELVSGDLPLAELSRVTGLEPRA
ncbi:hypothetical protein JOL79_03075 [Microbispora sp. RL4-1S]|uniref:Condensation domain-containing protein n=1 Tax=Microbispora oryzae TaxID=2806554 RepID=A0A940WC51_9ACTN|nr:condensation domain-containing protein [Microbispora oryzae]MBP2702784.1 hypothetical protein [Microbispora oryzae]